MPRRALALVASVVARAVPRVVVEGASMRPTLEPGDRLVCLPAVGLRPGQLVALADPRDGRLLVKRLVSIDGGRFTVAGDNPVASTDSRVFGPVDRRAIVGRVLWRYWPGDRRGCPG